MYSTVGVEEAPAYLTTQLYTESISVRVCLIWDLEILKSEFQNLNK